MNPMLYVRIAGIVGRHNMANAIWNKKEQRWRLDAVKDGERRVFTSPIPTQAGKRAVMRDYRDWLENTDGNKKVGQVWEDFIKDLECRSGPENCRNVSLIGRLYILPTLGKKKMREIRVTEWQSVINDAKPQGRVYKTGKTIAKTDALSKKTLSNIRGTIISFCRYAERAGIIDMPVSGLYTPKYAPVVGKGILQSDQLKALFAPCDEWYVNAWRFMAVTGLRPGEVYGMQHGDIKDGVLTISRAVNNTGHITDGKNHNAKRQMALHKIALDILQTQAAQTAKFDGPWVFPNLVGQMPCQSVAFKGWQRFRTANNITVPPYSLRHTFISMVKNDMPAEMVKAIVGHSAAMDTFGVYGHQVDGELQRSAKILDITFEKYHAK